MSYPGVPREKLPWFPTINPEVCLMDLDCVNFCSQGVFEWDPESRRPFVAHPYSCIPGCDSCAQMWRVQAISFSSKEKFRRILHRLREEARRGARPPGGG